MSDPESRRHAARVQIWMTVLLEIEQHGVRRSPMELAAEHEGLVHVITAWNPSSSQVDDEINVAADRELADVLCEAGVTIERCIGSHPDGSWREEGWAAVGLTRAMALEIGRRFGQDAIYEATAEGLWIVWCDSGRSRRVVQPAR